MARKSKPPPGAPSAIPETRAEPIIAHVLGVSFFAKGRAELDAATEKTGRDLIEAGSKMLHAAGAIGAGKPIVVDGITDVPNSEPPAAPNSSGDVPDLHPLDTKILHGMLDLGAVSKETRQTAANIAVHVKRVHGATQPFKERLPELRRRGMTESWRGKTGGHWLTPVGVQVAQRLTGANRTYDLGQS
jgi:hypothetical protein